MEAAHREEASVLAVARGQIALLQVTSQVSGVQILMAEATEDTAPVEVLSALVPDVLVICVGAPTASQAALRGTLKAGTPFIPGYDVVGTVLEVGPGVYQSMVSRRVAAAIKTGGWASHVLAPSDEIVPVPGGVAAADAEFHDF